MAKAKVKLIKTRSTRQNNHSEVGAWRKVGLWLPQTLAQALALASARTGKSQSAIALRAIGRDAAVRKEMENS